ncbi:RHS repeat domain-containing protein [Pleionea mediterranea]|uniref:RHS repeat-associated protein n=1 Tax=Pleionea mediterranea TaxID=523701 RepID=A0A316FF83_9GAMM|nr:RHS repeat-associated core domain-containing protein [Pleionea mediterranea]PWK46336.1 RHS repeat-associated protein [Pleionea mediterranea]
MKVHKLIQLSVIVFIALIHLKVIAEKVSITFIHTDHLGSPIMATDESGKVKWREDYQPFGNQIINRDIDNNIGFTGHKEDKSLGLTYMQARWYNSEVGRFMSLDPATYTFSNPIMSFNRYLYVNNNPYNYNDPDGKFLRRIYHQVAVFAKEPLRASKGLYRSAKGLFSNNPPPIINIPRSPESVCCLDIPIDSSPYSSEESDSEPAVVSLPDLDSLDYDDASSELEGTGFEHQGETEGGYDKWYHPDGSRVQIRPDGEVVRNGPKITPEGGGKKFRPRYDPKGNKTKEHNTGERIKR